MQLTNGNLFWQKKSKIQKIYPYLTNDKNCEVLIVGGGITGAITAYFLAKEGVRVILAEKNIIGYLSTSADSALLEYQSDVDMYKLEKMIGENATKRVYKLCLQALDILEDIDKEFEQNTGFKRQDSLYFTNKYMQKQMMNKECDIRKKAGFNVEFLDSHKTINLSSGVLTRRASGIINPYAFTQALISYISTFDNVDIYENTKIEDVKCKNDSVECRTNNNFHIIASHVIFTCGFETIKLLKNVTTNMYKTFTIVSKPIEELKKIETNFTAKDCSEPFHHLRFTSTGRIFFGGENIKYVDKLGENKYLTSIANDKYRKLYATLQKTFSNDYDIPIEYAFNSTYASTKDGLPIIDEIDNMPNCFCNLGFGSNGILHSIIGANMLKDAIKGYYTKDMNMFKANRLI
ncbi:MAG: FAD-dependent oxidoreductase [Clostridia bacterium]